MSTVPARVLDLGELLPNGHRVLEGHQVGRAARTQFDLDELDRQGAALEVRIPEGLHSLRMDFFEGLFGPSVRVLGEREFLRRYRFVGPVARCSVSEGIDHALNAAAAGR